MRNLLAASVLLCLLAPVAAVAADYRVDIIVTLNRNAVADVAMTHGSPVMPPSVMAAVDISDRLGLQRAGISLLSKEAFGLQDEWQKLRNSRFRPVLRLAWRLAQRPTATAVRFHDDFRYRVQPLADAALVSPQGQHAFELSRLEGKLLVQQSAGLRVQLDLNYTVPLSAAPSEFPSNSTPVTLPAAELATLSLHGEKRVNPGQVNFFDHPLMGVLLRVTRAE